jgi:hypothetical protein
VRVPGERRPRRQLAEQPAQRRLGSSAAAIVGDEHRPGIGEHVSYDGGRVPDRAAGAAAVQPQQRLALRPDPLLHRGLPGIGQPDHANTVEQVLQPFPRLVVAERCDEDDLVPVGAGQCGSQPGAAGPCPFHEVVEHRHRRVRAQPSGCTVAV